MNLDELKHSWNTLAKKDAMWAVLTGPYGAARQWEPEAFFRTGVDEIEAIFHRLGQIGAELGAGRALDFGCGVGRLTQALALRFGHVDGVDISEVMLAEARRYASANERCEFHLNTADDLRLFADHTFDFVYSNVTLQHMRPEYSRRYIQEFFRVLKPGGVACFQIPGEPIPVPVQRTRSATRLPWSACRARIEAPAPLRCAPGAQMPLRILVRNAGDRVWPWRGAEDGQFWIRLGNHWRHRFGWMLQQDDARMELDHDLGPGERMEIGIRPTAPLTPGRFILEFDMVQERVRWFGDVWSPRARTRVEVDASLPPGTVEGLPAVIEMHGIPRPEVERLMAESSGVLLAADDNDAPGAGWTSYRYFARRL